jgi:DNA-binding MarR family transcriptional regulator/ribosomal protein S18 acetylase RimI-like enzyme
MNQQEIYFELGIGTRLRRLYEALSTDTDRIYSEAGFNFKVSYFYVIYALSKKDHIPISEISRLAGFSHSAVSQTVKKLTALNYVALASAEDGRQKLVCLTEQGKELLKEVSPLWQKLEETMKQVISESSIDFMEALEGMEAALVRETFYDRTGKRLKDGLVHSPVADFDIVAYDKKYKSAFYELNVDWLQKFFKVEPIDELVLSNPEDHILGKGGEIFFAVIDGKAVGAIAMKSAAAAGVFELTKLGVNSTVRQGGIGKALCEKVIERFKARAGDRLYLETNTALDNAIRLYKRIGFKELLNPIDSPYERSNYYMEWQGKP